eukprot:scaffold4056_cov127-Skeletonema_menzelii.AAC.1
MALCSIHNICIPAASNMSSKKRPKLAVISQAATNATNSVHSSNTITVVVCPKKSTSIRLNETEKQHQFPYYERLCQNYGFSIQVEITHCQQQQNKNNGQSSTAKKSGNGGGGPKMTHFLLNTSSTTTTSARLHHYSERLIIRPLNSSRKKNELLLRPDFENGDVITSMDGMTNPTFGMIYAVMMRGDKLLLEIERRGIGSRGRSDSSASSIVDLMARQDTTTDTPAAHTATVETAAATTTSKQKRQVSAWDAENRRVQREQKKLQREQEKERLRLQQADETNGDATAGTTTTTAATDKSLAAALDTTTAAAVSKKLSNSTKPTTTNTTNTTSTTATTTLNVHSPNYITKAVARLEQNVQQFNRQQRDEEEAMYGEGNRMLLDYTLADGVNGDEKKSNDDDDVENEVNHDEEDKAMSIATMPTAALTFDDHDNVGGGDHNDNNGDDSFSIVNSLGSSDYPPPLEPSSPIQTSLDAVGKKNDSSSSYSSSDSSSSVPSSSSSSSDSSSVPSSSSSSDSDSSLSNKKCNSSNSIQPPQTITTTTGAARNGNSNNGVTTTSAPATAATTVDQLPAKRPRSSSSISNDEGGKTYPTYSSTMNYPSRNTIKPGLNKAPTSLGRLWPDPSDIVKALTKWQPPSATVKQRYIEFYGE